MRSLLFSLLLGGVCVVATAQVTDTKQTSADKSASVTRIAVDTMDSRFVPLVIETKKTKVDPATTRTDSVVKAPRNDGTLFNLQQRSAVTQQISPDVSQTTTEVSEQDRQGAMRATRRIDETSTRTGNRESVKADEFKRDASGRLVLDREIAAVTTKNADGSSSGSRTEKARDVSGNLVVEKEIEETVLPKSSTETQITRRISSVGHLDGQLQLNGRETTTVRTEGNTSRTVVVSEALGDGGWRTVGQTTTTEKRGADGTVQRETIEQGRSLYEKLQSFPTEPLVPQRKIVEREVRQPDGTSVLQRDVYRRDVNGEWKPVTFSLENAAAPAK